MIVSYTSEDSNTYEITFDYDPDLFGEDDPSQSPWHYITIENIANSDGQSVEFDDDHLYDIKKWLWKEHKNEF